MSRNSFSISFFKLQTVTHNVKYNRKFSYFEKFRGMRWSFEAKSDLYLKILDVQEVSLVINVSLSLSLFAFAVKEFNLISALRRISSRATWTNGKDGKSNRGVNACLCPPREPETRKEQWNFVIAPTDGKTTKCPSQGLSPRFIHSPFRSCGSSLFCRLSLNRFLRDESRSTFFLMYLILGESDNWSRTTESRSRVYRPLSKMKKSRVLEEKNGMQLLWILPRSTPWRLSMIGCTLSNCRCVRVFDDQHRSLKLSSNDDSSCKLETTEIKTKCLYYPAQSNCIRTYGNMLCTMYKICAKNN